MLDTHCHLTYEPLVSKLEEVLQRADAAGVSHMLTVGTDAADARRCIELCQGRENLRCSVGVHPGNVARVDDGELGAIVELAASSVVIAIGEIGLDYHRGREHRQRQIEFFIAQTALASRLGLPAIVHSRDAVDDALAVLRDVKLTGVVFHCFTGSRAEATRILDAGYFLGFDGPITFKKSDDLRRIVEAVPMDRMLLETDSPFLSPEPVRKQSACEPAFLVHTAKMVAQIKGRTLSQVDELTTSNASRLFRWPS